MNDGPELFTDMKFKLKGLKKKLYPVFFLLFHVSFLLGQSPYFKNFSTRDGLPSNNIYFVGQDSKGYVWLCTDMGVSRFDGRQFFNYTTSNGLTDNEVFSFFEDEEGRVWFATLNGLPCFYKDGIIYSESNFPLLDSFYLEGLIHDVFQKENGDLIFASDFRIGRLNIKKNKAEVQMVSNLSMRVWDAKGDGLGMMSGDEMGVYEEGEFNAVDSIIFWANPVKIHDVDSLVYFSMVHKLLIYDRKKDTLRRQVNLPSPAIEAIAITVSKNDYYWVGCRNGAYQLSKKDDKIIQSFLKEFQVSKILEDNEGGWWFSTLGDGLFYAPAPDIIQLNPSDGKAVGRVNCLMKDDLGRLWAGFSKSNYGVYEQGELSVFYDMPKNLVPRSINNIKQIDEGEIILIGKSGALFVEGRNKKYMAVRGSDVAVDANGDWWVATRGLYQIEKDRFQDYQVNEGEITEYGLLLRGKMTPPISQMGIRFVKIEMNKDGCKYLGSPLGLFYLDEKESRKKLLSYNVKDLIFENEGELLWVLTESNGMYCFQGGEKVDSVEVYLEGSQKPICFDACIDENGHFWIATDKGLVKVEKSGIDEKIFDYSGVHGLGREKLNAVQVFGDKVYLGKDDGLVAVPKKLFERNASSPPIYLKSILVNDKMIEPNENINLKSNQNSISFYFEGLSFLDYKKLTYRYRLNGYENEWNFTESEMIQYASLPPGDYFFEVYSINSFGEQSTQPVSFKFSVNKPFWKQWWFWFLSLVVVSSQVFVWVKRRETKLKRKYEYRRRLMLAEKESLELQKKNAELKMQSLRQQMNPHFVFNALNTIKGYYSEEKIKQANRYISKFARLLRLNLDYSDSFIPLEKEIELLRIYLQLYQIRFPGKVDFMIEVDEFINVSSTLIPSMIIQPFIENALIHGFSGKKRKGKLRVTFKLNGNEIQTIVEDDGIGRTAASEKNITGGHKSLATKITLDRLKLLRNTKKDDSIKIIDLVNEEGSAIGTKVKIQLPQRSNIN